MALVMKWQFETDPEPPHRPSLQSVQENGWPRFIGQDLKSKKFVLWGLTEEDMPVPAAEVADKPIKIIGYFTDIFEAIAVGEGREPVWKKQRKAARSAKKRPRGNRRRS